MTDEPTQPIPDASLRCFLLGTLSHQERDRIECLFLTDSTTRARILAAEEALMEDYLEGSLTPAERERFLWQYRDAAQQRALTILKALKAFALDKVAPGVTSIV